MIVKLGAKEFNTPSRHHYKYFSYHIFAIIYLQYCTAACVSRNARFINDINAGWW